MTISLPRSAATWGSDNFKATLQKELTQLGVSGLPLQQGLKVASYALEDGVSVMLLGAEQHDAVVVARVGVFFKGMIAGCSCADDPTPEEIYNEYCELKIALDLKSAEAEVELIDS